MEVYSISSKGGTEWRVLDAVGFEPIASPDGRFIAFVRGDINPVAREDYRGPSNRDIWLLDTKTKKSVSSLVDEAAFMSASLYELRQIINEKGYTEDYQNGENQKGTKKCSEVEIYIQLSKNYMSIIKQLTDLLPRSAPVSEKDQLEEFANAREDN